MSVESLTLFAAFLPVLVVVLSCFVAGRLMSSSGVSSRDVGFEILLGMFVLHAVMQWASHLGLMWSRSSLLLGLILTTGLVMVSRRRLRPEAETRETASPFVWSVGDALCLIVIGLFAWLSVHLEAVHSDFIFHWGPKGERFFLAGGIDWGYLSWPENAIFHPDYPQLLPDLYAATALVTGEWNDRSQQLYGVVFLTVVWLVCRKGLVERRSMIGAAALVAIVGTTGAFGIGYYQTGGPDLPFAALVVVATAELLALERGERGGGVQVLRLGVVAGLLASCKIEGLVMATILVALSCWSLRKHVGSWQEASIVGLGFLIPALIATLPWGLGILRHDLLQSSNLGAIELGHVLPVLETTWRVLLLEEWQGLAFLILLLPMLFIRRTSRPVGLLLGLQLVFYFYIYLVTPHEPVYFVLSNLPRLLYHLVPALLLALFLPLSQEAENP